MAPPRTGREAWLEQELERSGFGDGRLDRRFRRLAAQLASRVGGSIFWACEDWASTKAAYRFLANPRIEEGAMLAGHFAAAGRRVPAGRDLLLVLHDTTEFSFQRRDPAAVGMRHRMGGRRDLTGRPQYEVTCGIAMHSSLVVTTEGLPLGLAAVKFWSRKEFKGCNALKKSVNPTRVPIEAKESIRWLENMRQATDLLGQADRCLHIGDRESDIFELFCAAREIGTHFLVRTCVDRLCWDGSGTIADEMAEAPVNGLYQVSLPGETGPGATATLELCWRRVIVQPPIGK